MSYINRTTEPLAAAMSYINRTTESLAAGPPAPASPVLAALHRHNEQLEKLAACLHELELRLEPVLLEQMRPIPASEKEEPVSPVEAILRESSSRTDHCIRRVGGLLDSLRI